MSADVELYGAAVRYAKSLEPDATPTIPVAADALKAAAVAFAAQAQLKPERAARSKYILDQIERFIAIGDPDAIDHMIEDALFQHGYIANMNDNAPREPMPAPLLVALVRVFIEHAPDESFVALFDRCVEMDRFHVKYALEKADGVQGSDEQSAEAA